MIAFPASPPQDTELLGDEIARLAAHLHAATYQLLVLIRSFDEQEGWGWGFRSCAQWLSWRTGIGPGPAREKVRVARALASLPLISGAMARGQLSFSMVRALTRVASPKNEAELLELARHATAAHMERLVRAWRRVDRIEAAEEEAERHQSRYLRLYPGEDGSYVLRGRLDPEVGALLGKALEWATEALYRREAGGGADADAAATPDQRWADALGLVVERAMAAADATVAEEVIGAERAAVPKGEAAGESAMANDTPEDRPEPEETAAIPPQGRADRFQVVVHVEAGSLGAGGGENVPAGTSGPSVPAEPRGLAVSPGTARRLACDAGVVQMTHDADGGVLDVGRKRRTVPPALRRALDHRDRCCRFPGCGSRYTDAHHITHWADGGETKLENLVSVCRLHHRAVHEEGFRVELVEDGGPGKADGGRAEGIAIRFYRPDGRLIPEVPEAPAAPVEPVKEMERAHRDRGITPDAWTATPLWNGEPLDYGLAIDMLRPLGNGGTKEWLR